MKKILPPYVFFFCLNLFSLQFLCAQSVVLDPVFGNKGIVQTDMGSVYNYSNYGRQVLVQPDGTMYMIYEAAGITVISRKKSDGTSDPTYGVNGYSNFLPVYKVHAVQQADGKIVLAGYTKNSLQYYYNDADFAVARINTDGTLDTSFDGDGLIVTDMGSSEAGFALALQDDGKIVVAGASIDASVGESYLAVIRYNTNGSTDKSLVSNFGLANQFASSVVIQPDGKILVAGSVIVRLDNNLEIDSSFGTSGIETIPFTVNGAVLQADGKIVIAGVAYNTDGLLNFVLARYQVNGEVDETFGNSGLQMTSLYGKNSILTSVALQADQKIILGGYMGESDDQYDFALVRYKTDGSIDESYGLSGKQVTDFNEGTDYITAMLVQPDGKLLTVGYTANNEGSLVAAARYNDDGNLDSSFGGTGMLTDHITQGATIFTCTALQNDGKIVAAGHVWNGNNYDFALARYNADGSFDNTFSGDGKQLTDINGGNDFIRAVKIQADGKIIVAGRSGGDFSLARYNVDGSLDISFDNDGTLRTSCGSDNDAANSLVIQDDGKILAGGSALVRYNIDGSLDASFGDDGKLTAGFGEFYTFNSNAVAIQKDGKIIAAGTLGTYCLVARYNLNGTPDMDFGQEGLQFFSDNSEYVSLVGKSIAIQDDGKIVIGGYAEYNFRGIQSRFALLRLNEDGSFDETFNEGQTVYTTIKDNNYGNSVLIQPGGKIILGGYSYNGSSDNFTMARYNTDGSIDISFGNEGSLVTQVSSAYDRITAIAISANRLYAVGYGQFPGVFGVVARYMLPEAGALPVTLLSFTGNLKNKAVTLQWKTTGEYGVSGFGVERSADGANFSPIGFVAAISGSSKVKDYSLVDDKPLTGVNFYRLKLNDNDGKYTYSKVISVLIKNELFTWSLSPNPVANVLSIRINSSSTNEKASFLLTDINGKNLREIPVILNGNTSFPVYLENLPKGVYNLQVRTKNTTETKRFVKE